MLKNKKFIQIESVMRLATIMVLTIVFVFYIISSAFVWAIIDKENEHLKDSIKNSFSVEHNHDVDIIREYSFWHEAYHNIHVKEDNEWIELHITNYVFDIYDYDWIAVESNDFIDIKAKVKGSPAINEKIKNLSFHNDSYSIEHGFGKYYKINDILYRVVAFPFIDSHSEHEEEKHESHINEEHNDILIFGKKIDEKYLDKISNKYHLPKINITDKVKDTRNESLLIEKENIIYGSLYWKANSKTKDIIPYMIIISTIISACFVYFVRKIIFKKLKINAEYSEKLYLAATKDSLTNISNRRFFMDHTKKEFSLLNMENRFAGLLVLDLDYFKKINDKYGHTIGDKALIHFSDVCSNILEEHDLIGRIGGEEFAIFLPDSKTDRCLRIADKIHQALKDNFLIINNISITLSVSIGISTNEKKIMNTIDLFKNADNALYEAKNNGRNQSAINN